jgi:hypothetical protein
MEIGAEPGFDYRGDKEDDDGLSLEFFFCRMNNIDIKIFTGVNDIEDTIPR